MTNTDAKIILLLQSIANGKKAKDCSGEFGTKYQSMRNALNHFYRRHHFTGASHAIAEGFRRGWLK